jgi:hypothetical protein
MSDDLLPSSMSCSNERSSLGDSTRRRLLPSGLFSSTSQRATKLDGGSGLLNRRSERVRLSLMASKQPKTDMDTSSLNDVLEG